jgi:hypothetical protein
VSLKRDAAGFFTQFQFVFPTDVTLGRLYSVDPDCAYGEELDYVTRTNMVMRFGTWNVRTLLQTGNMMEIRRWRNQCKEREEWKRITEKAKTHGGL